MIPDFSLCSSFGTCPPRTLHGARYRPLPNLWWSVCVRLSVPSSVLTNLLNQPSEMDSHLWPRVYIILQSMWEIKGPRSYLLLLCHILDLSFVVYPILSYSKDQFHVRVRLFRSFDSHTFAIYVFFIAIFTYLLLLIWSTTIDYY
jgi:hypothetical protein